MGTNNYDLVYYSQGDVRKNNSVVTTLSLWNAGDIIGVAYDAPNGLVYFYKNGVVENSGTGIAVTAVSSSPNGVYQPAIGVWDTSEYVANTNFGNGYFGTSAIASEGTNASNIGKFEYDVPTGYTALSTKGLNI